MEVTKSSNVIVPEIIPLNKLQRYAKNDIFVNVVSRINSVKPRLFLKEGGDEEPVVSPTYNTSTKKSFYIAALKYFEIKKILNK